MNKSAAVGKRGRAVEKAVDSVENFADLAAKMPPHTPFFHQNRNEYALV